jgi:peroxiredoxin
MFSLPGAFTPTCSAKHLPGFVAKLPELKAQGIDMIACLSVNDAHVMKAWAEQHDALGKIVMLADGSGNFSKALGIDYDSPGMGLRARRGLFTIEDGTVKSAEIRLRQVRGHERRSVPLSWIDDARRDDRLCEVRLRAREVAGVRRRGRRLPAMRWDLARSR